MTISTFWITLGILIGVAFIVDGLAQANRNRRKKRAWWRT